MVRFLLRDIFSRASGTFITRRPRWLMPLPACFELESLFVLFRNKFCNLLTGTFHVATTYFSTSNTLVIRTLFHYFDCCLCIVTTSNLSSWKLSIPAIPTGSSLWHLKNTIVERSTKRSQQNIHSYLQKDCQLSRTNPGTSEARALTNSLISRNLKRSKPNIVCQQWTFQIRTANKINLLGFIGSVL